VDIVAEGRLVGRMRLIVLVYGDARFPPLVIACGVNE
jgi:hypothetical protein